MAIPQPIDFHPTTSSKQAQSRSMRRFYREAAKRLPTFTFKVHFNAGGPAVWGETYAHIYQAYMGAPDNLTPVVEAYDTNMGLLVRQWDGKNSGYNHYVQDIEQFVSAIQQLAARPFVRF